MTPEQLVEFETRHNLWTMSCLDYPIWMNLRPSFVDDVVIVPPQSRKIYPFRIIKSFLKLLMFFVTKPRYDQIFFLACRRDLLEFYRHKRNDRSLLFVNFENDRACDEFPHISCDALNIIRFLCRIVAGRVLGKNKAEIQAKFKKQTNLELSASNVNAALGDAIYYKILQFIFGEKSRKFYSVAVVPLGEKLRNRLNSFEVQHGIISEKNFSYIGVPGIRNTLIVYDKAFEDLLRARAYSGSIVVDEYKKIFLMRSTNRHFPVVIYTQPIEKFQVQIKSYMNSFATDGVFIQKHPRDVFDYDLPSEKFVTDTLPGEVDSPVLFCSSVIEDYLLLQKKVFLYDSEDDLFHLGISTYSRMGLSHYEADANFPRLMDRARDLARKA